MDYEKKYKEALEVMRQWVAPCHTKKQLDIMKESVFPELYESEDERVRKEIIDFIQWAEDRGRTRYDHHQAKRPAVWIAYLEKQKEREEGDCTYEAKIYWKGWNDAMKQKEQKEINLVEILKHYPKETELYSPLYGKLWLAEVDEKNEIITCYQHPLEKDDVRATLEQEDTISFYSNGTTGLPDFEVSKDCMLFLYNNEKQKEQKHAPDDLQKSFEAGQASIVDNPEQYGLCKKAEWTENKFPKNIEADAVQFCFDNGINITPYQAKQIATHYLMVGHNEGYIEGRKNAHIPARELGLPSSCDFQKEQKPKTFNEPYNPDEYEVVMEGNATGLKRKEQKPIEDVIKDITENKESATKFLKSAGIMDDNGELAEMYRSEQKPVDNGTREKIISRATSEKQVVLVSESDGNAEIGWDTRSLEDAKNLLEYGISFINKQLGIKPAEWSEEEKGILLECISILQNNSRWVLADRLKSLRPQLKQEWNEEDKKNLNLVTDFIYKSYPYPILKDQLTKWLKSLLPSWKPSEEQMEAFRSVLEHEAERVGSSKYLEKANSLYEQLNKL